MMKNRVRILYLEDSSRDFELVEDALRAANLDFELIHANSAKTFESALGRDSHIDLILCDYNLPDYDGFSALIMASQNRPDVPVLIISGTATEEDIVGCLHRGATDYILKQRLERLGPAVKRALEEADNRARRQEAELKLKESEERFRQLAEQSQEGFWFASLNPERITYVSPAVQRIWGQPPERFYEQPRSWMAAVHSEDQSRVLNAFEDFANGRMDRYDEEYRIRRPDGSIRWVQAAGTAVRDGGAKIVRLGGIVRDVTERKELEAKFLRAQRMESIGALASGIAHDLNNALVPVMVASDLLRENLSHEDRLHMLDTMKASTQRAAEMVKQVLSFARGVSSKPVTLSLKPLVNEIAKLCRDTFPRSIRVESSTAEDLFLVKGNATQIHQVLLNLSVNARDAMPDGGVLRIDADNVVLDRVIASGRLEPVSGPHVVLTASDTGIGMPPEVLGRIFEPFFTTKSLDKGTGLGLSTVQGIVKAHNGFLEVSSRVGQGTTFKLYFPATGEPSTEPENAGLTQLPMGKGELILLVDDDLGVLEMVHETLEAFGYRTVTASNGLEALPLYQKKADDIAAVVTDMMMPFLDGPSTIRMLRQINPRVKIIGVSGLGSEPAMIAAGKISVEAFLKKPYSTEKLLVALRQVLAAD